MLNIILNLLFCLFAWITNVMAAAIKPKSAFETLSPPDISIGNAAGTLRLEHEPAHPEEQTP